jgi:hypothetical protein
MAWKWLDSAPAIKGSFSAPRCRLGEVMTRSVKVNPDATPARDYRILEGPVILTIFTRPGWGSGRLSSAGSR